MPESQRKQKRRSRKVEVKVHHIDEALVRMVERVSTFKKGLKSVAELG